MELAGKRERLKAAMVLLKRIGLSLSFPLLLVILECGGGGGDSSSLGTTGASPASPASLTSISTTPANPSVPAGVTKQFTATGTYSDGTTHDQTSQVTWNSSDPTVATINSSGSATTVAAGTATISAESGSISANTILTVTSATLASISVTPGNPSIFIGFTKQLTATGTFSDNTTLDLTTQVTWSSSSSSVATISSSGLTTAVATGTTTISASLGSISGSTTLTVASGTLSSISLTSSNQSILLGSSQQFAATGTFSDGTSHDITMEVAWSSSDTSVATVSSNGLAKAVATGTATITAISGNISGNTTFTATVAGTISLAWDPPTDADGNPLNDHAGYKLYYGTASGTYDHSINVGKVTTYTLTGLTQEQTYYIAVTTRNKSGKESGYSNEVSGMAK